MACEVPVTAAGYRIFDCGVRSEVPLPGLPTLHEGETALEISVGHVAMDLEGFKLVHEWKESSGETASACFRRGDEYLLRFPAWCDFLLNPQQGSVTVHAHEGVSQVTVAHLLIDQVIPRLLFQRGRMVVHASAVTLPNGRAVVFVARSGSGKSSLAAYCDKAGLRMIADDTVILEMNSSAATSPVRVIPAYPSLRLWPDMIASLFPEAEQFESVAQYTSKLQRFGSLENANMPTRSYVLEALVFLGDPAHEGPVQLAPLSGRDAAVALLEALFTLDIYDSTMLARNLGWVGQVSNSGIPVLQLDYARTPSEWPRVLESMGRELPLSPG